MCCFLLSLISRNKIFKDSYLPRHGDGLHKQVTYSYPSLLSRMLSTNDCLCEDHEKSEGKKPGFKICIFFGSYFVK